MVWPLVSVAPALNPCWSARGGEDALPILLVDRSLEPPPAGEAVLARDHQLGVGELHRRILFTQRLKSLFGFVAEMLEVGAMGKRRAHDEPSFPSQGKALAVCPASASLGQEVRLCTRRSRTEWAEPFTRTVGPSIGPKKEYRKIWYRASRPHGCMGAERTPAPYIALPLEHSRMYRELTRPWQPGDPLSKRRGNPT